MQLLTEFMESGEQIAEHCWDDNFGMSQLFARAWAMARCLATKMPQGDVNEVLDRLRGGFVASMVEVVE